MASTYSSSSSNSVPPFATITLGEISHLHDCNASEVRTYLALALHAGPDGDCWPGRRRLAEITGQSRENVSRSTSALAALGLIEKAATPTGRVIYHLPLHRRTVAPVPLPEPVPPGIELDTPPVSGLTPIEQTTINKETERESEPEPPAAPVAEPLSQEVLRQIKTAPPDGVPQAWIEVGQALRPDLPVEVIRNSAEVFLDYHRAKGTVVTNWLPAWRNWLRRERPPKAPQFAHKPLATPTVPSPYSGAHFGKVAQETAQEAAEKFAAQMARYGAVPGEGGTWNRPGVAVPSPTPTLLPATPQRTVKSENSSLLSPRLTADQTRRLAELAAAGISPREVAAALAGRV